jgi:hypothetical protein
MVELKKIYWVFKDHIATYVNAISHAGKELDSHQHGDA